MWITLAVIFVVGSIILGLIIAPAIKKIFRKDIPLGRVQVDYKPVFDITRNDMYVRNKIHTIHTAHEEDNPGDHVDLCYHHGYYDVREGCKNCKEEGGN